MTTRDSASFEITPEVLLRAYACGIFPMAESADDPTLFWVEPEMRGVIPLRGFRIASRLARTVRSDAFTVTVDTAFKAVIAGCAAPQAGRDDTWSTSAFAISMSGFTGSATATVSRSGRTTISSADYMASAWAAPFSAKACFTAPATPRKSRWCIWWRG
jgi:hypothetical protein